MTVNYNFDLEDDDFFADTFRSISENDLLTSTALSRAVSSTEKPVSSNDLKENNIFNRSSSALSTSNYDIIGDDRKDYVYKDKQTFENITVISRTDDTSFSNQSPFQDLVREESSIVNSRFTPGFTPKAKKRKFPGPAGIFSQQNVLQFLPCDPDNTSTKKLEDEIEVQDITNSQFSADDLLLPSWQNLQADVSSCQTLLSTAKYYSIRRVLHETSKKKLPKHIVVPVLCVLIKKFNHNESTLMVIDDTGEISGKIDKEVLDVYKEYMKAGTALILRKVTFLCNVLLLKKQTLVSIYLEDGSVKHIHELNSILDKEEPLKLMSCECPGTPKSTPNGFKTILNLCDTFSNVSGKSSNLSCVNSTAACSVSRVIPKASILLEQKSLDSNGVNNLSSSWTSLNTQNTTKALNTLPTASITDSSRITPSGNQTVSKTSHSIACVIDISLPNPVSKVKNFGTSDMALKVSGSAVLTDESIASSPQCPTKNSSETDDLFCGDSGMDEFDELLCNLDEKSFIGES